MTHDNKTRLMVWVPVTSVVIAGLGLLVATGGVVMPWSAKSREEARQDHEQLVGKIQTTHVEMRREWRDDMGGALKRIDANQAELKEQREEIHRTQLQILREIRRGR